MQNMVNNTLYTIHYIQYNTTYNIVTTQVDKNVR